MPIRRRLCRRVVRHVDFGGGAWGGSGCQRDRASSVVNSNECGKKSTRMRTTASLVMEAYGWGLSLNRFRHWRKISQDVREEIFRCSIWRTDGEVSYCGFHRIMETAGFVWFGLGAVRCLLNTPRLLFADISQLPVETLHMRILLHSLKCMISSSQWAVIWSTSLLVPRACIGELCCNTKAS